MSHPPTSPRQKRGGQPGNQNARKSGAFSALQPDSLSPTRLLVHQLQLRLQDPASPLDQIVEDARSAKKALPLPVLNTMADYDEFSPVIDLSIQLQNIITRSYSLSLLSRRRSDALAAIAHDPFGWFERGYRACGISRDADSFFVVLGNSAHYSPLPPHHPRLATNLTEGQWSVLAPLIPPDPHLDWLTGQPPVIIAANRWAFTRYEYTGEFNDFVIMQEYYQTLQRFPALCTDLPDLAKHPVGANPPCPRKGEDLERSLSRAACPRMRGERTLRSRGSRGWGRGRGRPRTSPRALLDAIFWKLATAQPWQALPVGFPPMRLCRKYYRRLFLSGRLYTLLLALYNHMVSEASVDLPGLLKAGIFTTTPSQKIALTSDAPATWEIYTALLFMQLARSAYTRLQRQDKQSPPISARFPDFKGASALSTGQIPGLPIPLPQAQVGGATAGSSFSPERKVEGSNVGFQPLESSLAWKKWAKIEQDQKIIAREVSRRLHAANLPDMDNPVSSSPDEEEPEP